jgi:hypothetical protein
MDGAAYSAICDVTFMSRRQIRVIRFRFKSTTEYTEFTEMGLVFLCVLGALCGFAVIFPEKLRSEGGEFVAGAGY